MSQSDKALENFYKYSLARDAGHLDFLDTDYRVREYFAGSQWDSNVLFELRQQGRPALTINLMLAKVLTMLGEQISTQADVAFAAKPSGSAQVATALTKIYRHIVKANQYEWVEQDMALAGILSGRGYCDVRVDFSDNFMGDVKITRLRSRDVVLDPDIMDYDPDTWPRVFRTRWVNLNELENLYGREARKEVEAKTGVNDFFGVDTYQDLPVSQASSVSQVQGLSWAASLLRDPHLMRRYVRIIEHQHRELVFKDHFVNPATGELRVIPDTWDRERVDAVMKQYGLGVVRRKAVVIRWTQSVGDVLLFDAVSPYDHFTIVPYFPIFIDGRTVSPAAQLVSPQDVVNKSTSQILHIVNSSANGGWQVEEGQLVNMTEDELEQKGSQTGLVLVRKKGTQPLQKIEANHVPTGLDRVVDVAASFIDDISGVPRSMQGKDRADVAAKAIQLNQDAGQLNLSVIFENMDRTRHILARNVLSLIQKFYTEERAFNFTHPAADGGLAEEERLVVNTVDPATGQAVNDLTVGEYEVVITKTPLKDSQRRLQFEQAVALRKDLGVPVPDEVLIKNSSLLDKEEVVQLVKQAGEQQSQLAQQEVELKAQLDQAKAARDAAEALRAKADATLMVARARTEVSRNPAKELEIEQFRAEIDWFAKQQQARIKEIELTLKAMEAGTGVPGSPPTTPPPLSPAPQAPEQELQREAQLDQEFLDLLSSISQPDTETGGGDNG